MPERKVWTATSTGCPMNQRSLPAGRWGRLKLGANLLPDVLAGKAWGEALALGARMFTVEVRHEWGELEVLALSPDFEEIGDGECAPTYDAWFERQEDGTVKFLRFERL